MWWTLPEPRLTRLLAHSGYASLQAPSETEDLQSAAALHLKATAWAVRRPCGDRRRPVVPRKLPNVRKNRCKRLGSPPTLGRVLPES
jgi:hypothetical protein